MKLKIFIQYNQIISVKFCHAFNFKLYILFFMLNSFTHKAMKKENTTLSSFISTLDAEILKEDEAILLTGGFASATTSVDAESNYGCNTDNCSCPITNNC